MNKPTKPIRETRRAAPAEWLSLGAAARLLGVHTSTLRMWADKGEIPAQRTAGRHRRFRRADIEAWAAARRDVRPSEGQLIVEHMLGRTRLQMAEGRLADAEWYRSLSETSKHAFRDAGRQLLGALMRHLEEADGPALDEARQVGREYERLGRAAGLSLPEKVALFLFFSEFLYESVLDVYRESGRRAAGQWAHLHRRVATFINAVLLALVEAHAAADGG